MKALSKEVDTQSIQSENNQFVDEAFLADIVHKAKNSLGGICGFATLLKRDFDPDDPKKRLAQRVEDGVLRLNEFLESLMTLVRVVEPKWKNVQLHRLVKDVLTNYYIDQQQLFSNTSVESEFNEKPVEISADVTLLRHLFLQLVQFVKHIGGKIESVQIDSDTPDFAIVSFSLVDCDVQIDTSEDLETLLEECESVEARLSLSIMAKMSGIHKGKVAISMISPTQYSVSVYLSKGLVPDEQ